MEASEQHNESKAEPKAEPPKEKKAATKYVALVHTGKTQFEVLADEDGKPIEFGAYRPNDVIGDLVSDGKVQANDDGKTPFIAIVPARSFQPRRATIATKTKVSVA